MPARKKSKSALPASLTRNAAKKASAAAKTAAAEARTILDEIREKKRQIEDAFYDIGVALTTLSQKRLYSALGHRSFGAMVESELGIALATAKRLMAIPKQLTRKRALSLGQSKSLALIRLAAATPERDTAEELARGTVTVRGHRAPIRPGKMSAREIERAVRTERSAHRSESKRPADAALARAEEWAKRAEAKLRTSDPTARVSLKQGRRDGEPTLAIEVRCDFDRRAAASRALAQR